MGSLFFSADFSKYRNKRNVRGALFENAPGEGGRPMGLAILPAHSLARRVCRRCDWLPLALLPLASFALRSIGPRWAFMWSLAFSLFLGFKWLTWRRAHRAGSPPSTARSLAYLLLWPGMEAEAFLDSHRSPRRPPLSAWAVAAGQTLLGGLLLWVVARMVPEARVLIQGWVGLAGLAFLLHFGSFQLLAVFWQRLGVEAAPIMRSPLLADSLGDFWGKRWNSAFRELSHSLVFKPLRRRAGRAAATLAAFLASGIIHELVISVPAGAGYGLPTGYFLLQGIGVLVQRSPWARRLHLSGGWLGRAFSLIWAAAPAFWLFHPPFLTRVVIPLMTALGAL